MYVVIDGYVQRNTNTATIYNLSYQQYMTEYENCI